ncbi:MAG: sigma-70 family RNA polymerase sigma factor [Deltaproteobacteria bacterium]|nr:sigma-70 family RNA polymerase sigma factor [Deltaproteobacteria bacterium]
MIESDPERPDDFDEPQGVEVVGVDESDALASSSSSLTRRDPLGVYMRDVQRYTLLSKEEEHDLAVRFLEEDDLEAAKRLVTSNLRLVVKIAYDYRQAYKNILDLVQEGNIGLMQAVKKYDPYKGVHRLVKVGTTQAQRKLFFNLQKEKARLSAMGIEPTAEVIAENLNVPERDVVSMDMRLAAGDASLDAPVGTTEGRSVARVELLPSEGVPVDDTLAEAEVSDQFSEKIHEFGKSLENKEKKIFEDRLVAEDPKTLQKAQSLPSGGTR